MSTRQILRTIIAIGAGVMVAVLAIMVVEGIGHRLAPVPVQPDPTNPDMAKIPVVAMVFVVAAWFLGVLAGGAVANHLARRHWPAWIIAGLVLCGALYQFAVILHPVWMMIAGVAAPLIAGWIVTRRVPRPAPEPA